MVPGLSMRQLAWRVLFLLAAAWVAWSGLVPVQALPAVNVWDKLAHALAYCMLTLLLTLAIRSRRVWNAGGWMMVYGISIEVCQSWTGYRSADWQDVVANGAGVLAAVCLWYLARWMRSAVER